jgi:osmotically-inducible protein OsmY
MPEDTKALVTHCGGRDLLRAAVLLTMIGAAGCSGRRSASGTVVETPEEARIRQEIEARLAAEPAIQAGNVRVEVRAGTAVLHGGVNGIGAWKCAIRNASLTDGVQRVADLLVLEHGPPEVTCLAPRELRFGS